MTWIINWWKESYFTHMNMSCLTYEWVASHVATRHVRSHMTWLIHTFIKMMWWGSSTCVTCRILMCDTSHSYARHDSSICEIRLISMWDMTHSRVRHDSFTCVTCCISMCDTTHSTRIYSCVPSHMTHLYMGLNAFKWVTWLNRMCDTSDSLWSTIHWNFSVFTHISDTTYWYVGHDSFTHSYGWCDASMGVTLLIPTCDMTHSHVWRDSFIGMPWLMPLCVVTSSYVRRDSFM